MKIKRKFRALVCSFATGALLSYLLDPVSGRRRREHSVEIVRRVTADLRHLVRSVDAAGDALAGVDADAGDPERSTPAPAVAGVTDTPDHSVQADDPQDHDDAAPDGHDEAPSEAAPAAPTHAT